MPSLGYFVHAKNPSWHLFYKVGHSIHLKKIMSFTQLSDAFCYISPQCAPLIGTKSELNLRPIAALVSSKQMYLRKAYLSRKGIHEIYLAISGVVLEPHQTDFSS